MKFYDVKFNYFQTLVMVDCNLAETKIKSLLCYRLMEHKGVY